MKLPGCTEAVFVVTTNVMILVLVPILVATQTVPDSVRVIQSIAWAVCLVTFARYCRDKLRVWLEARRAARRRAELRGKFKDFLAEIAEAFGEDGAMRFLASMRGDDDPMAGYFRAMLAWESIRRNKSLHGYFDAGGHFIMEEIDSADVAVLAGEMEHPDPDKVDDLDNSWEPES